MSGDESAGNGEDRAAERDQPLLEGPIGESGWRYRTARLPGHIDLFGPDADDEPQSMVIGGPIREVRPLHDDEDRQVLIITERAEVIIRRDDQDRWVEDSRRGR